jgi:hypothetical protein
MRLLRSLGSVGIGLLVVAAVLGAVAIFAPKVLVALAVLLATLTAFGVGSAILRRLTGRE